MAPKKPVRQERPVLENWTAMTAAAVVATLAALAAIYGRFFPAFRLTNDDWALVWNSVIPYITPSSVLGWFTEGYTDYFVNYPDWPAAGFPFVRPTANMAYFVEGLFARGLGDPAYLLVGYASILLGVSLMMLALRRYTNLSPALAAVASFAFGLSPVWYQGATIANMVTSSLATLFSLAAIVVLDARRGMPEGRRLWSTVLLLVLAVWSHETAAIVPIVCVALLYGMAPSAPRIRDLAPFAVPIVVMLLHQTLLSNGDYYVFAREDVGAGDRLRDFVPGMVIPFMDQVYSLAVRPMAASVAIPYYLGILTNLFALGVLVYGLVARPMKRRIALVAAVALAAVPSAIMFGLPRFAGYVLVVTLITILYLTAKSPQLRAGFIAVFLVSTVLHLSAWTPYVGNIVASMPQAAEFYERLEATIRQERPDAVVLVNDNVGDLGALSMLRIAAWPESDIDVTVLNGLGGAPDPAAAIEVSDAEGVLEIRNQLAGRQWIMAHGAIVSPDLPNNGFTYEPLIGAPNTASFIARRPLAPGKTLVVGNDPATGQFASWVLTR